MEKEFPVLGYHRVEDSVYLNRVGLYPSGETCSLIRFRAHMEILRQDYNVVPLDEVVKCLKYNKVLPEKPAVITFDDGVRDSVDVILPVLLEFGFTATFFIMSLPLEGKIPPTFKLQLLTGASHINEVIKILPEVLNEVSPEFAEKFRAGIEVPPERYIGEKSLQVRQLKYMVNYLMPPHLKDRLTSALFEIFFEEEAKIAEKMFCQAEDLKKLAGAGMTIGSHGKSHINLATISSQAGLEAEVVESKDAIAMASGVMPEIFAYPAGGFNAYSSASVELVKKHYSAAVVGGTQKDPCSTKSPLYELPRINEMNWR